MLEHRNLMNLIEYVRLTRKTTPDDIVAEFASFCFDASGELCHAGRQITRGYHNLPEKTASKVAVMCLSKNISIVYADVFKYPTVRELAAIVDDQASDQSGQSNNEFAGYNYNKIQSVISGNVEENVDRITREKLGDIMITGATGFLGIHILKAYLDNYDGKVYCLVRKGAYESIEKRMMHMLMYYFDNPCEELFKDRIVCVDGDITSKEQVESFAAGDVLEKINVHGVENLIDFCKGEFQINFITNGFLRSLRGYKAVGKFPMGSMHEIAEPSPIDSTALAVLKLVQTEDLLYSMPATATISIWRI